MLYLGPFLYGRNSFRSVINGRLQTFKVIIGLVHDIVRCSLVNVKTVGKPSTPQPCNEFLMTDIDFDETIITASSLDK